MTLSKDEFLDAVYILVCDAKDNFQKFANQNLESQDALVYVEAAMVSGELFMTNQTCLALAEISDEKTNTYFQDPQGAYGFCPKDQYELVKAQPLAEEENNLMIDNDFHTEDNKEVQKIYG